MEAGGQVGVSLESTDSCSPRTTAAVDVPTEVPTGRGNASDRVLCNRDLYLFPSGTGGRAWACGEVDRVVGALEIHLHCRSHEGEHQVGVEGGAKTGCHEDIRRKLLTSKAEDKTT